MILFLFSLISVTVSSYLVSSCFADKKYFTGFIYLSLSMFAQIVVSIEVLSLFKFISVPGILLMNVLFLACSILLWVKKGKPLWRPEVKKFIFKIIRAFKKDKLLAVLGAGLLFFILVSVFLCFTMPVVAYDSLSYHLNRALFWASNGSLLHFDIADDRNIVMAINSEILYTWFFTFVKRNLFIGFFSLAGYFLSAGALWSVLEQLGYNVRKRLWAVFMMSALAGVILEASGSETNVLIGGLMLAGTGCFIYGAKHNRLSAFFFSSLAFALAIGTKSTALFILPSAAIICAYVLYKNSKNNFTEHSLKFLGLLITNIIVFASFNYILNFLHFGNLMGSTESLAYHSSVHTVKGFIAGFIRHLVLLFDFTGFSYTTSLQKYIFSAQNHLLSLLNIPLDYNVINTNADNLNNRISDPYVGGGLIGVIVFIPCMIVSLFKAILHKEDKNCVVIGLFGLSMILSIAFMSFAIGFMLFSARFIVSFLVFASPVFVLSYIKSNKNIFKYIILFYVMSYYTVISTHIWTRHFVNITKQLKQKVSISDIRNMQLCSLYVGYTGEHPSCTVRSYLYANTKPSKIGLFTASTGNTALIKLMEKDGYKVDSLLLEKIHSYKIEDYDYLIFAKKILTSAYIDNYEKVLNNYELVNSQLVFLNPNQPKCVMMARKGELVHKGNSDKLIPQTLYCEIPVKYILDKGFRPMFRLNNEITIYKNGSHQ